MPTTNGGGGQIKADALAPKTNINQPPGNRQNDGKKTDQRVVNVL